MVSCLLLCFDVILSVCDTFNESYLFSIYLFIITSMLYFVCILNVDFIVHFTSYYRFCLLFPVSLNAWYGIGISIFIGHCCCVLWKQFLMGMYENQYKNGFVVNFFSSFGPLEMDDKFVAVLEFLF